MKTTRTPRLTIVWRVWWTLLTLCSVQVLVLALSLMPIVLSWLILFEHLPPSMPLRAVAVSAAVGPSYVAFALCVMVVSPTALRVLGWQTPADVELRLADMDWALLRWVRYGASIHVVRVVAGTFLRGTPLWTVYLRLSGARLGRGVYVNSLAVSDYNLLEFGDGVVIGGGVHLSAHTVEAGVLKTARVHIDRNVTVGLNSVIEIGVYIGPDATIGALSFVPKYAQLPGGTVYAGAPAMPLE